MGYVILPSGTTIWADDLKGSVNLSTLITDMRCDDYTTSYRLSIIRALAKLGKSAGNAVEYLKELTSKNSTNNEKLLAEAAEQAIKKIGNCATTSHQSPSNNHYSYGKKTEVQKVTFTEIETETLDHGLKVYCKCNFCNKLTAVTPHSRFFSDRLASQNRFFCNFCIRNDYYQPNHQNVLILTYRGIIGYYYYAYNTAPKTPTMYSVDIQDYIDLHVKCGLQNPIFQYDSETLCWFVDFGKIGKTRKKMPVESVLTTIIEQLACFNLYDNVRGSSPSKLYKKYENAVTEFYQHRTRVNDERIFAPTLWGCDIPTRCPAGVRAIPVDILSSFTPSRMADYRTGGKRYY